MKISCQLLIVAALAPMAGTAHAIQSLDEALKSPASFDEALPAGEVRQVTMLEPTLADAPATAPQGAPSIGISGSCCGSACDDCCGNGCNGCGCGDVCNTCCCPLWSVRAGAVILERTRPDRRRLIEDRTGGTAGDGFADAFDFGFEGGPDISITRWLANGKGLELRYFGALQWEAEADWTSASGWALPTNPPRMGTGIANIEALYASELNSTEINYRGAASQPVAWLIGFRWIELHEELDVDADFGANMTEVHWDTDNHLYGGQIGAVANLWRGSGPLTLESALKAGIYGNDADNVFALDQTIGPDLDGKGEKGQVAFVGDIAITTAYPLTDNVALRSGYQLLWIEGVALASEQVSATNIVTGNGIDSTGEVFYHGALISLDMVW